MEYLIFVGRNVCYKNIDTSNKVLIGVDYGAYEATLNNITLDYAIGDFDSSIQKDIKALNFIRLNPVKDLTDTEYVLSKFYNENDKFTIIGGIQGKRIEHLIANLNLLNKYDISFKDDSSLIFKLNKNESFKYSDYKDYKFVSFFALKDSVITLKNLKYELNEYNLRLFDSLCISNEFSKDFSIEVSGSIMVIFSKNDIEINNK